MNAGSETGSGGPYLTERQWGTVREDYSEFGDVWEYFPRSRAYRWDENGLLGICDRQGRLYFALVLWNGRDPILKERLFGLTGPEGNHGEDVKEAYFYLDSTPTHSYLKALYKYPPDRILPAIVGMIERALFVTAILLDHVEFIAVWLALKAAAQWGG
jgi:hypothetical protein